MNRLLVEVLLVFVLNAHLGWLTGNVDVFDSHHGDFEQWVLWTSLLLSNIGFQDIPNPSFHRSCLNIGETELITQVSLTVWKLQASLMNCITSWSSDESSLTLACKGKIKPLSQTVSPVKSWPPYVLMTWDKFSNETSCLTMMFLLLLAFPPPFSPSHTRRVPQKPVEKDPWGCADSTPDIHGKKIVEESESKYFRHNYSTLLL
jgi:hypothetical protein